MIPYRLVNRRGSGGFVVEAALTIADVPFTLEDLGSAPGTPLPESFRNVNPWRQIPVLTLPDGTVMTETAAILIHLAACHPQAGLAPSPGTPEHATFLRWIVFTSVNIYEGVLRAGNYASRATTAPDGAAAVREAATDRTGRALRVLDAAMPEGGFMPGEHPGALDLYAAMLSRWFRGEVDTPRLRTLVERVRTDTVVGPLWRYHFERE